MAAPGFKPGHLAALPELWYAVKPVLILLQGQQRMLCSSYHCDPQNCTQAGGVTGRKGNVRYEVSFPVSLLVPPGKAIGWGGAAI